MTVPDFLGLPVRGQNHPDMEVLFDPVGECIVLHFRKEQMLIFESDRRDRFDDSLVTHVRTHFANHYEAQGETGVRQAVRLAQKQAADYGFESERSVFLYLTTVYMLGSHFDEDPLLPWVGKLLVDKPVMAAEWIIDNLVDQALVWFQKVTGPEQGFLVRALVKLKKELPRLQSEQDWPRFEETMAQRLRTIDPTRYETLGAEMVDTMILATGAKTERYGLERQAGRRIYVLAVFLFGSCFDRDPMWVRLNRHLTDITITNEETRIGRLYEAATGILSAFLKNLNIEAEHV